MIEGDIKGYFDNIDHNILAKLLKQHISDQNLIDLYWKLVNAGYVNNGKYEKSFIGVPQGGVISPLLSNLYLHEFDKFMVKVIQKYSTFDKRVSKHNPKYSKLHRDLKQLISSKQKEKANHLEKLQLNKLKIDLRRTPSMIRTQNTGTRVYYNRYADDWVIGVTGTKAMADEIKAEVRKFLHENLALTLSEEKTKITHVEKAKTKYLGFYVSRKPRKYTESLKSLVTSTGNNRRGSNHNVIIEAPIDKIMDKLVEQKYATQGTKYPGTKIAREGNNPGELSIKPRAMSKWISLTCEEIVLRYNAVIRGILYYYNSVENRNQLSYVV